MKKYEKLDALIVRAIEQGCSPLYEGSCASESTVIAEKDGRRPYRVIDGRLQALRKSGRIRHVNTSDARSTGGWQIVENTWTAKQLQTLRVE